MRIIPIFVATVGLVTEAGAVQAQPRTSNPPSEKCIVSYLGKVPPWMTRTVESIEREEIYPGYWKCTVIHCNELNLFWGIFRSSQMGITVVYIDNNDLAEIQSKGRSRLLA